MSQSGFVWLTTYAVNAVWQVAVLAAAAWGLSRCIKSAGPELQHRVWVGTLLLATLVPATPVIRSYFEHGASGVPAGASTTVTVAPLSGNHIALTASEILVHPMALYVVSGLYLAILLFFFLRLCRVLYSTAALVRNAEAASTETQYADLWHASRTKLSVPSTALLRSREIPGPMTAGLRRPALLLPATFMEDYSETEFLAAVAHECAHIQRDDFRKNVFYEIVSLLTVFHPVTWFIKSQIAQTRELVCDRMAAEHLPDRRTYALSLLQLAGRMRASTPVVSHAMGMFDSGILERRIMTLTASLPRLSRIQRSLWTVTAMLLLSTCAGGIGLMTRTVAAQTTSSSGAAPSPAGSKQAAPDLACTYYEGGQGAEGTCGYDKKDKTKYRCYSNSDPVRSNPQLACEWKLRRAEQSKK